MATANAICLRFQVVVADCAAILAFLTAGARTATNPATTPTKRAIGINLRIRRRLNAEAMDLILIVGNPVGAEVDFSS